MGGKSPAYVFTIPSIADSLALDCRIYHPSSLEPSEAHDQSSWKKQGTIVAHPYAPLGGNMVDAVVMTVVDQLLRLDFVVAIFNFRGAPGSKGKTSWSGKAEREDYISVTGLLIYYLQQLSLPPSHPLTPSTPTFQNHSDARSSTSTSIPSTKPHPQSEEAITLLLAGYSYGSLITSNLPPTSTILSRFSSSTPGSPAHNILLRARTLSAQTNETLSTHRGRQITFSSPRRHHKTPSHPIVYGGDEPSSSASPAADDTTPARRSAELPQRMIQHIRKRSSRSSVLASSQKPNSIARAESGASSKTITSLTSNRPASSDRSTSGNNPSLDPETEMKLSRPENLKSAYLLISPLLPPLSSFLVPSLPSFLTTHPWKTQPVLHSGILLENPTLAVFGSEDGFTAAKKLGVWGQKMQGLSKKFEWRRIEGAGHFWREEGAEEELRVAIGEWVERAL